MKLYELTEEYNQVLQMAEDGDVSEDVIKDTLESISASIEDKADNYAKIINTLTVQATAIKEEEARLSARRKTLENNAAFLKKNLEQAMILTDNKKFKTTLFSFNIQKNPASLVIDDESSIPAEFKIPQPDKIDNAAIKEALKKGGLTFAHLTQTESLRIR